MPREFCLIAFVHIINREVFARARFRLNVVPFPDREYKINNPLALDAEAEAEANERRVQRTVKSHA